MVLIYFSIAFILCAMLFQALQTRAIKRLARQQKAQLTGFRMDSTPSCMDDNRDAIVTSHSDNCTASATKLAKGL